jgi:hypothetical protein
MCVSHECSWRMCADCLQVMHHWIETSIHCRVSLFVSIRRDLFSHVQYRWIACRQMTGWWNMNDKCLVEQIFNGSTSYSPVEWRGDPLWLHWRWAVDRFYSTYFNDKSSDNKTSCLSLPFNSLPYRRRSTNETIKIDRHLLQLKHSSVFVFFFFLFLSNSRFTHDKHELDRTWNVRTHQTHFRKRSQALTTTKQNNDHRNNVSNARHCHVCRSIRSCEIFSTRWSNCYTTQEQWETSNRDSPIIDSSMSLVVREQLVSRVVYVRRSWSNGVLVSFRQCTSLVMGQAERNPIEFHSIIVLDDRTLVDQTSETTGLTRSCSSSNSPY